LDGYGLEVVERVQLAAFAHEDNIHYLTTKRDKMGHLFDAFDNGKHGETNES